jgi:hypothetical protein
MDWVTTVGLALAYLGLAFILLRVEQRAAPYFAWLLVGPIVVAILVWALLFRHWGEALGGAVLAALAGGAWYLAGGRLARARSDTIKVWGQETAPRPKPSPAALQAEIDRLKEETRRMEAEISRLKGQNGSQGGEGRTGDKG